MTGENLAEAGKGIMDILVQPPLGGLPVGKTWKGCEIGLTPKLCALAW